MKLSNKQYDVIKAIVAVVIPATSTFYFALATIWGFPYGEQILGTLAAVETFLGSLLHSSSAKYKKLTKTKTEISEAESKGE